MARPPKPQVGTGQRLAMDLADYGDTWRFIRDRIDEAGGKWGARRAAIKQAAKTFNIDYKTAERHYERLRKFDTPDGMNLLAGHLLASYTPAINDALSLVHAAFSEHERIQLSAVGSDLVIQLARERLELLELRKRKKRK